MGLQSLDFRHTPHVPPSCLQCVHDEQFLHALQGVAPTHVASARRISWDVHHAVDRTAVKTTRASHAREGRRVIVSPVTKALPGGRGEGSCGDERRECM